MKTMSLYQERDTLVHKISPISKIMYIIAVILLLILVPLRKVMLASVLLSFLIIISGRVLRKVFPIIGFSSIVLISVVIIQGLFNLGNKTALFSIGSIVFYKEGLLYAFDICLRVLNILSSFAILVLTTKPSELIESLVRKGLSPRIGYVLNSVLQIIPQMSATMNTITEAQRSRGMETEGSLKTRIKAFFPLIGPVVMSSLINTRERAMALEVRGFNSSVKKTFLNEEKEESYDKVIQLILILIVIVALIWRILS
ncbi:energy-coupling factor transporter transmembrane protein EcfT [Iocasia frigidifontis]|uniref:Energy-coupling factor transporter transmembrane protein EcfT n=1 Tax=Iocasia fonsfrigidae TaxID=2682810 RepID=A0A8A7KJS8_9FIRM|nr:energy-coupling factor transporter transmembrane protein EcfT [Iocasia fonsfrigidae]